VGLGNEFCPEGVYTEVFYPTGQYWFYP